MPAPPPDAPRPGTTEAPITESSRQRQQPNGEAVTGQAVAVSVLIVDDSPVQRRFLRGALEATDEFTVIGEARNGKEAVAMVESLRPATILMDLDLPQMNGLEAIERIMAIRPTPIIVFSAFVDEEHSTNAMQALAAGAVDVVPKPSWGEGGRLDEYADTLRRGLRAASRVRVITHPRARLRDPNRVGGALVHTPVPFDAAPAAKSSATKPSAAAITTPRVAPPGTAQTAQVSDPDAPPRRPLRRKDPSAGDIAPSTPEVPELRARTVPTRLIAIGCSTGGPQALATILGSLPTDIEPAILVVQHMAEGFIPGLVSWLEGVLPLPVVQGANGKRLQPGTVTVATTGHNTLVMDKLRVVCEEPPPKQFHVPGIDASFQSIADHIGAEAIGVVLTGMGRDGAVGLKAMRERGASTIGQDEASSAVYGMPAAAWDAGAVERQLPLTQIGPALLTLLGRTP